MQDRLKNGVMSGVEFAKGKALDVLVAAADPQVANYKVTAGLTMLGLGACYYRNTPYVGNFLFFSEFVIGTGLLLNQYGVQNTLTACMLPFKSAYQAIRDNGSSLYRSYVPSEEVNQTEPKVKKTM